jgi:hypothetical protein
VPQLVFHDLVRLFALTGPVVLAIDQVDGMLVESDGLDEGLLADRVAEGLMKMRQETVRTIVVIACIPKTWELISTQGVNSAADRFTMLELSTAMPSAAMAMALVEQHLGSIYGEIGFAPPHPTWPVLPVAFDAPEVASFTPRKLLKRVEEHVRSCLDRGVIEELRTFAEPVTTEPAAVVPVDLAPLDGRFAELRAAADVVGPLDHQHEDGRMFALLNAGLRTYVLEQGSQELTIDPPSMVQPALHARLRRTLDEAREDEEHWSFRAIAHPNPRATLTRLRSACLEAEIKPGVGKRHLAVLRNIPFSVGQKTSEAVAELEAAHGMALPIAEDDLRTFSALRAMLAETPPGFLGWLANRRPAGKTALLRTVLDSAGSEVEWPAAQGELSAPESAPVTTDEPAATVSPTVTSEGHAPVVLGRNVESGREFGIGLAQLRKHAVVFAGSGSGKTVLLRRLVEDVALHGVSSIVLDPNNDLARLGDRWPSAPGTWWRGDDARAERYFADTDVVIWTPRREAGRPIALNPLPDFAGVLDDPDELRTSIDACVAGLMPRSGLRGAKIATGKAVLTQALDHFARHGGSDLDAFVALLADLPEGVSTIRNAVRLAEGIADELRAAMINDPVFGGAGEHLDPAVLLTPAPGKRARVSVISFIGLPSNDQRQTFVNQLQLALFSWIKRHPAGDRPLGGLLVLDEAQTFVPSRGVTASTESTLQLAAQARKYGLGIVYATQAPKGLHSVATGNAATQFFGYLNAPVHIHAAKDLARAKGGQVDDISRLSTGRFYAAAEGSGFAKIQTPMCLSHHPDGPLVEEEVLQRARRRSE